MRWPVRKKKVARYQNLAMVNFIETVGFDDRIEANAIQRK
jgi:hypothetical protein